MSPKILTAEDLVPGRHYRVGAAEGVWEFSRIGGTGMAICHPPGEPDMQSSIAVRPEDLRELGPMALAAGPYRTPSAAIAKIDHDALADITRKLAAAQEAAKAVPELAQALVPIANAVQQAIALRHAEDRDEIANAKFKVIHETETYTAYLERYKSWAQKRFGVFGRDGSGLDNDGNAVLTPFGRERLRSFDAKHDEPRFAGFDAGRTGRDT